MYHTYLPKMKKLGSPGHNNAKNTHTLRDMSTLILVNQCQPPVRPSVLL